MSLAEKLRTEGIQEGEKNRAKKVAKIMIVEGEKIERIMAYTGLTEEEVGEVKEEILQ